MALPITTITRDEIARSGVANIEQLVKSISAVSTAGAVSGSSLAGLATYGQSSVSLHAVGCCSVPTIGARVTWGPRLSPGQHGTRRYRA